MRELPRGWVHAQLSEICAVNPRLDKTIFDPTSLVAFVPMSAVEPGTGNINIREIRSFETVRKGYKPFREDDILFAKITPCMENGKMAIVPELVSAYGFGSTEFHVLRPHNCIDPRYIYYAVSSHTFRFHAKHNMTGAVGQKRVPEDILKDHEIGVPPLNEQRRIVEKIEALFEEIDRGVESLRAAKSAISLYRKSLLKSAFEGCLTAEWRARNPDKLESPEALLARIRNEREVRYQAAIDDWKQAVAEWTKNGKNGRKPAKPTKLGDSLDMTRRDMMEVPKGWVHAQLSEICAVNPRLDKTIFDPTSLVAFVPMSAVEPGTGNINIREIRSFETVRKGYKPFREDDILFAKITPCMENGKMAIVPELVSAYGFGSTEFHVLRPHNCIDPRYIYYAVSSHTFRFHAKHNMTGAVGQKRVPEDILKDHEIGVPPPNEQRRIVEILDARLETADKLEAETDAALARADTLRQSILKKAFAGQLVSQDPTDEPASALLDRIKAERAAHSKLSLRKPRKRKVAAA